MQAIIGIDPGREKCGFAVVANTGAVLERAVIDTAMLPEKTKSALIKYQIQKIVMGNGTTSKLAAERIKNIIDDKSSLMLVDEYRTTDLARQRYFADNPPTGLKKLIPRGMLYPPVPVDDYVAVILAERWLSTL